MKLTPEPSLTGASAESVDPRKDPPVTNKSLGRFDNELTENRSPRINRSPRHKLLVPVKPLPNRVKEVTDIRVNLLIA